MTEFGTHTVELHQVTSRAPRQHLGVELSLDGDAIGDRMQSARESQQRGDLGDPRRRTRVANGYQFGLDIGGEWQPALLGSGRT